MKKMEIICYKHDGSLHRVWHDGYILEESDDHIIIVNNRVDVIDGDGRKWRTREPAVCFFYKKKWFNIISMIRTTGIYYYCNLGSPYIIDEEGLKYIDYDLDVKVFPDDVILILDKDEYEENIQDMHYSEIIKEIIDYNFNLLLKSIKDKEVPFDKASVIKYYKDYINSK